MKFIALLKKAFGSRQSFVFKSDLAQSDFHGVQDGLGLAVPQCLRDLYLISRPKAVEGDTLYRFEKRAGGEAVEYVIRFLPISRENQIACVDVPMFADGKFIVFGIDDFANIYFMEANKSSSSVLFCDLEFSGNQPYGVSDSLTDFVMSLEPIRDKAREQGQTGRGAGEK